jgi:hypothetical protein
MLSVGLVGSHTLDGSVGKQLSCATLQSHERILFISEGLLALS